MDKFYDNSSIFVISCGCLNSPVADFSDMFDIETLQSKMQVLNSFQFL